MKTVNIIIHFSCFASVLIQGTRWENIMENNDKCTDEPTESTLQKDYLLVVSSNETNLKNGLDNPKTPPFLYLMTRSAESYQESTLRGISPVTLSAIIVQTLIYFKLVPVPWTSNEACMSSDKILRQHDYWKLLIAQIEHMDDLHLCYNMLSFAWKGKSLERRMGSTKFALLLLLFTGSTGITYVGLNYALSELLNDQSYMYQCAVGFSGVIFALEVLTTHYDYDSDDLIMIDGIPINPKYAVWFELVLISVIAPNASFVGHLAGILVGLAYVYGPLKPLLELLSNQDLCFSTKCE